MTGHVCKQRVLFYAEDEDVLEVGTLKEYPMEDIGTIEVAYIHAMDGGHRSRPLQVVGII